MIATVFRDGTWQEVPRSRVAPGVVISFVFRWRSDLVPADAWLLTARDLHVQQAALTGESLPVEKEANHTSPEVPLKTTDRDAVFFGTSVVSGYRPPPA
ncbi:MAG: hypothetical protein U0792_23735 [Gemmataceae bacterium]